MRASTAPTVCAHTTQSAHTMACTQMLGWCDNSVPHPIKRVRLCSRTPTEGVFSRLSQKRRKEKKKGALSRERETAPCCRYADVRFAADATAPSRLKADVLRLADEFSLKEGKLDALVCNAGALLNTKQFNAEGIETTLGCHL